MLAMGLDFLKSYYLYVLYRQVCISDLTPPPSIKWIWNPVTLIPWSCLAEEERTIQHIHCQRDR